MSDHEPKNIAFIDGQNFYKSLQFCETPWKCDLLRFGKYLEKKYRIGMAFYFIGFFNEEYCSLYEEIRSAGFVLVFKPHQSAMVGGKKGNVDTDIVFSIMKKLYRQERFERVVLVSGDGDYKILVDFLIEENRLEKILFPDKAKASSLYKKLPTLFHDDLSAEGVKNKIKKGPLR